jgi:hypothetical protein
MTIYNTYVFTGDNTKPIKRLPKSSLTSLVSYLEDFTDESECSVIIDHLDHLGILSHQEIFFGTKKALLRKEETRSQGM